MSEAAKTARLAVCCAVGATAAMGAMLLLAVAGLHLVVSYWPLCFGLSSATALVGVTAGMIARKRAQQDAGLGGDPDPEVLGAARLAVRLGMATALTPIVLAVGFIVYVLNGHMHGG